MRQIDGLVIFCFDQDATQAEPVHAVSSDSGRVLVQVSATRVIDIEQIFLVVGRHLDSGKLPMLVIVHDCSALFRV